MTHVLRVTEASVAFRSLFAALEEAGERGGWLDLESDGQGPSVAFQGILRDGAWKTVAVEPERTVVVKRRRGPAVLRDLLREHFRGCQVVLVRGGATMPALRSRGLDWELQGVDGEVRRVTTADLVRALRAPHLPI